MLKESYVAKLKTLPKDAIEVEVGYPSIFASSEDLLSDFNELKWELMKKGKTESEEAGITVEGDNKWLTLMKKSIKYQKNKN